MGSVLRRLLFFFQRNQFDWDLEDELRFHEEMKGARPHRRRWHERRRGTGGRAAELAPLRLREQSREPWTFATVETFAQDARHTLRSTRARPAFTFTALAYASRLARPQHGDCLRCLLLARAPAASSESHCLVIVSSAQQTETGVKKTLPGPRRTRRCARALHGVSHSLAAYHSSIDAQLTDRAEPAAGARGLDGLSPNFFATPGRHALRAAAHFSPCPCAHGRSQCVLSAIGWARTAHPCRFRPLSDSPSPVHGLPLAPSLSRCQPWAAVSDPVDP